MPEVQPGQTYRSCDPGDDGFRIRIRSVGALSAWAVDARNGRDLPHRVPISSLHTNPLTTAGRPRRTGYVLEAPNA